MSSPFKSHREKKKKKAIENNTAVEKQNRNNRHSTQTETLQRDRDTSAEPVFMQEESRQIHPSYV